MPAFCEISNVGGVDFLWTLPSPFRGCLAGGRSIILSVAATEFLDACGGEAGMANVPIRVKELPSTFSGATDDDDFGTGLTDFPGDVTITGDLLAATIGPDANSQHTLPDVAADTVVLLAATQTLTNKTLTSPTLTTPVATSIGPTSQLHTIPAVASDTFALLAASQTLTNKTLTAPAISAPTISGSATFTGRKLGAQGVDVASTGNLVLGNDGNCFEITGTTQIDLLSNIGWQNGSQVTLLFTSTPTVKHATATSTTNITILLARAADFAATAGDTLSLLLSEIGGTQAWREVSRAVI